MATLIDLNQSSHSDPDGRCDVCVIGGGAAGLYLAHRLSRHGLGVIILEAGGETCVSGASIGIEPIFSGAPYRGAVDGRAFGWGGSTSRWGGLLVPHSELDARDAVSPECVAWKHIINVVQQRSSAVFSTLALGGNPDFFSLPEATLGIHAKRLRDCGLETLAAEFLPWRRRNLVCLAAARMNRNLIVYLNALASKWNVKASVNGSGVVSSVEASSQNERSVKISAKSFVIAAGAIESARILLEIDRFTGERMFCRSAMTGRYLSDHLSCAIADVHPDDQKQAANLFGPIFSKGRMRSFRFIESFVEPLMPRHFAHFIFEINNSGFRLIKDFLSSLQARALGELRLTNAIDGINGLLKLAYYRFIKSSLFIPRDTPAHFQLDVEQTPNPANRVYLGEQPDRFGRPIAVVDWNVSSGDLKNIAVLSQRLITKWPDRSLGFPRLVPIHIGDTQPKPYDAYHPVGTCRMGTDREATVDLDLKVRRTQNLFVLSTGVFPSAGTANPTFSMFCLGDMLADKLANHDTELIRSTS